MLFNSVQFILFFILVGTIYRAVPHKLRWFYLLLASYYFYMCWKPEYIVLILASTIVDYIAGLFISKSGEKWKKRIFLILSLCSNLGILMVFKYFNFFSHSFGTLFRYVNLPFHFPELNFILPVGISFYTFQTLSYTIDVYRGKKTAEKHLGKFALYVAFFPQLVAGPIERSNRLLPQFHRKAEFNSDKLMSGLGLILWGLFKKTVIADRISFFVNQVYNNVYDYYGLPLILATVFFAFQIYCDFSGYSDIAIGTARILGIELMKNFNRPYFSKSISEFWKRWHISLSSWFRDYLYIPLGGNRVKKPRWYINLFIVFLVSGLWHGANWTFVVWGALNGLYILASLWTKNIRGKVVRRIGIDRYPRLLSIYRISITFTLTCFAWIFFRANTISDTFYILTHLFKGIFDKSMIHFILNGFGYGTRSMMIGVAGIVFMEVVHFLRPRENLSRFLNGTSKAQRIAVYSGILLIIIFLGNFSGNQFIYFQF